ncbi:MAG TPA: DUF5916 domain-containing protein [Thermoanaerobaculia bacterium]|nr:DUF5916 domain-containing protein [Thermoanaerobaculia bacterium]
MRKTLVGALLLSAAAAFAELPPPAPALQIHRAEGPIKIDGDLSDPGWKNAARYDHWVEGAPADNIPATKVKTIAYLTYDDRYFYIGIRCDDPDPRKIRAPYVERDNVLGTDDNIAVFLDTRNDKRTALELRVNPRGIQADGIFDDANGNEDFSPDYFYDTAAKIDAGGWSAEYAIPFSSLRYPNRDPQTWNILIWRNYPRDFRYAFYSSRVPRTGNCLVCNATPIVGLTGLPHAGHLTAAPYVTGQQTEVAEGDPGTPLERTPFRKEAGLDVKWTPTADNAIDLTLNPDFSQVESDVAQITANQRFAVFFPEKRPFFLEGFDIFDTPFQVAYTRTITSPMWGARTTGRTSGTTYTLLVAEDRGGGSTIIPGPLGSFFAPSDFKSLDLIGRIRHDLGTSFVGAVLTDREIRGGGYNRVFGPDFQWRPNVQDEVHGELLLSSTENPNRPALASVWDGARSTSHAFDLTWNRQTQTFDYGLQVNDIGSGFRADLGFLPQVGYREMDGYAGRTWFPTGLFNRIRASFFVDRQTDSSGDEIFRRSSPGILFLGKKNLTAAFTMHLAERNLVGTEELSENYLEYLLQIDPSRRFTRVGVQGFAGQRIDFSNARVGTGATVTLTSTIRPVDKLSFDLNLSREWLDVEGGKLYTAWVDRLKGTWSFSAKSIVRVIGQYVSTDRNPALYTFPIGAHDAGFQGSVLYSYKLNWQTVFYLGYGDDRALTLQNDLAQLDRSLFFKVSYAFQQ